MNFLMEVIIVFFYICQLLFNLNLSSPQDIFLLPGFIPLVQDVDQHTLTITVSHSQPLHLEHFLVSFMYHLLQPLLGRVSSSSHFSQLGPQPFRLGGLRTRLTWS
jgi:hypothetical protein